MCYAVGSPSWRWWQTKDQRGASLLGRGDGQTRGLSLHAGLQPELDFDWITNTSIELAHTPIGLEYINWASTRINWTSTHIKSSENTHQLS